MYAYVINFSVLGRTARVMQFVCIIPAITQTVATVVNRNGFMPLMDRI